MAALDEAGSPLTDSATDYLAAQQCEEGYFRLALGATLAAGLRRRPGRQRASTDVTALAVLNLQASPQQDHQGPGSAIDNATAG